MREALKQELETRAAEGLLRSLSLPAGIDVSSNDYLGLAEHPALVAAASTALGQWGLGARAARLLRGHLAPHQSCEAALAEWLGAEAALLLPSGWQANQALVGSVAGPRDAILSDALNHASLIDACRLSRAQVEVFAHGDLDDLEQALRHCAGARRRLILVESVYSMDGTLAPLAKLAGLARTHDAWLIVDEAHALGVWGPAGAGRCREPELAAALGERLLARVITGGKSLGAAGGAVLGSREVIETVLNLGRAFVYTTAVPPPVAAGLEAAAGLIRGSEGDERRQRLWRNVATLRAALAGRGLPTRGEGPIVPVILGGSEAALAAAAAVQEAGFDARAVRPPTVPVGSARLRLVVHADHEPEQLTRLAEAVADAVQRGRRSVEDTRSLGSVIKEVRKTIASEALGGLSPAQPSAGDARSGRAGAARSGAAPAPVGAAPAPASSSFATPVNQGGAAGRAASAPPGAASAHPGADSRALPSALVVAGTDTDVGKTVLSALLCRHLVRQDLPLRYLKPVQTGSDSDTATVSALAGLTSEQAPPPRLWLQKPASVDQAAWAEEVEVTAAPLIAATRAALSTDPDHVWVLECAGGLLVPLNERETQADVLAALGLPLILAARSALGTLNHTLLSLAEARRRGLEVRALFLIGEPHPDNERTLRSRLGRIPLIRVPRLEPLTTESLDAWLEQESAVLAELWPHPRSARS